MVERTFAVDALEEKFIVINPSHASYGMENIPNEIEIKKDGVLGRLKLGFKFIDKKINNGVSNLDSIAVKFHDKSKRKFFWTI
jgi:hypothetical protein